MRCHFRLLRDDGGVDIGNRVPGFVDKRPDLPQQHTAIGTGMTFVAIGEMLANVP